jgi:hypothetical protein
MRPSRLPYKKNSRCRYCGGSRLFRFLSLGEQPPSDSFIREDQIASEKRYPLDVCFCEACFLVQLLDVVPAEEIFDDYVYLASSSKALKNYYAKLTETITQRFGLTAGDVVVDIGCNDGVLLSGYSVPGLVKVGVEPSKVAAIARESGFKVVNDFFGASAAREIIEDYGKAKVVTATNVFPHVDDIGAFTSNLSDLLDRDGVFMIEASYLIDLIDSTLFDTIYHEHLCYLSLTPVVPFLRRFGMEVFDVERVPFGASGPAIRIWAKKKEGRWPAENSVTQMMSDEAKWGAGSIERYQSYAAQVAGLKDKLMALMKSIRQSGARIGGYGAPAKGNTLLNYMGFTPRDVECIAENNKLKQGMLTPGSHIPVVSDEEFLKRMPEYALLLSWNYLDFFLANSAYVQNGGKFIVPIPTPRICP